MALLFVVAKRSPFFWGDWAMSASRGSNGFMLTLCFQTTLAAGSAVVTGVQPLQIQVLEARLAKADPHQGLIYVDKGFRNKASKSLSVGGRPSRQVRYTPVSAVAAQTVEIVFHPSAAESLGGFFGHGGMRGCWPAGQE